jgi:hypothetical protein
MTMTLKETQELMDSITSDKAHPVPVRTIISQGPSEQFLRLLTNTIKMRVPIQTETEQPVEISSQSVLATEAIEHQPLQTPLNRIRLKQRNPQ